MSSLITRNKIHLYFDPITSSEYCCQKFRMQNHVGYMQFSQIQIDEIVDQINEIIGNHSRHTDDIQPITFEYHDRTIFCFPEYDENTYTYWYYWDVLGSIAFAYYNHNNNFEETNVDNFVGNQI
jgi:hypothetical protein